MRHGARVLTAATPIKCCLQSLWPPNRFLTHRRKTKVPGRDLAWLLCCFPPLGTESASCSIGFSKLNSPAHRYLCLRFKRYLAISPARLEARMDSLLPFL